MGTRKALFRAVDWRRFCAEDRIHVAGVDGAADKVGVDLVLVQRRVLGGSSPEFSAVISGLRNDSCKRLLGSALQTPSTLPAFLSTNYLPL